MPWGRENEERRNWVNLQTVISEVKRRRPKLASCKACNGYYVRSMGEDGQMLTNCDLLSFIGAEDSDRGGNVER